MLLLKYNYIISCIQKKLQWTHTYILVYNISDINVLVMYGRSMYYELHEGIKSLSFLLLG